MFEVFAQAPAGVKAFLIGCVLIVLICTACAVAESVEESRHEKTHWRRGHG